MIFCNLWVRQYVSDMHQLIFYVKGLINWKHNLKKKSTYKTISEDNCKKPLQTQFINSITQPLHWKPLFHAFYLKISSIVKLNHLDPISVCVYFKIFVYIYKIIKLLQFRLVSLRMQDKVLLEEVISTFETLFSWLCI